MGWAARRGIAAGTARGLEYLHKGCQRRIIHRDIKASNVLLTDDLQPQVRAVAPLVILQPNRQKSDWILIALTFTLQISDFGLAKWLPSEWTHRAIAPIEGTFG